MILFWVLLVPLATGPLAFSLRRRPAMERVNLAAFAVVLPICLLLEDAGSVLAEFPDEVLIELRDSCSSK